jgi:hypothetical protein
MVSGLLAIRSESVNASAFFGINPFRVLDLWRMSEHANVNSKRLKLVPFRGISHSRDAILDPTDRQSKRATNADCM